jgi:shikimate kinase
MRARGVNLILVGYRGSGKTTVGQLVARRLNWRFLDLDEHIARQAGRSIAEIFAAEGEAGFRSLERKTVEGLKKTRHHVIALGGGTLLDPETRPLVKRLGKVVWLRAPAAILWARISQDPHTARSRPDLTAGGGLAEVETLLAEREPTYARAASHTIDTISMSPEEVAEAVEMWFGANDADSM